MKAEDLRLLVNKALKDDLLSIASEPSESDIRFRIPTGWTLLDASLGGGLPTGRIIEIGGEESAGKSTLAFQAIAQVQKMGGIGMLLDSEHTFDRDLGENLGVDCDKLFMINPDIALEDVFGVLKKLVQAMRESEGADKPILCVWDTLTLTPTRGELKNDGDRGSMIGQYRAQVIRQGFRVLTSEISGSNVCLLILNHIFEKMNPMNPAHPIVDTSGGRGVKYSASARILLKRIGWIKAPGADDEEKAPPVGASIRAQFIKNKLGKPRREVFSRLYFGVGFDDRWAVFDYAEKNKIIGKSGAWCSYTYEGSEPLKFYQKNFLEKLDENEGMYEALLEAVKKSYAETSL